LEPIPRSVRGEAEDLVQTISHGCVDKPPAIRLQSDGIDSRDHEQVWLKCFVQRTVGMKPCNAAPGGTIDLIVVSPDKQAAIRVDHHAGDASTGRCVREPEPWQET